MTGELKEQVILGSTEEIIWYETFEAWNELQRRKKQLGECDIVHRLRAKWVTLNDLCDLLGIETDYKLIK